MSEQIVNKQQKLNYSSTIPFSLSFDFTLPDKAKAMYAQIFQMQANPNESGIVQFSYKKIAAMLGISIRWARRLAKKLIERGLITHVRTGQTSWIWSVVDKFAVDEKKYGSGRVSATPSLPLNNIDLKNSESSFFQKEEESAILEQKLPNDGRSDKEFLSECQKHIEKPTLIPYTKASRIRGMLKILTKLKNNSIKFVCSSKRKSESSLGPRPSGQFWDKSTAIDRTTDMMLRGADMMTKIKNMIKPKYNPSTSILV